MDIETTEAIEQLGARIDASMAALRAEMVAMKDELRAEIMDSRRHGVVLYESLRDDIRMLAEAVAGISTRLDARGI